MVLLFCANKMLKQVLYVTGGNFAVLFVLVTFVQFFLKECKLTPYDRYDTISLAVQKKFETVTLSSEVCHSRLL